mgnify:FL=1
MHNNSENVQNWFLNIKGVLSFTDMNPVSILSKKRGSYQYWRLLLKARIDLDSNTWKKYLCFKNLMTEVDIRTK